MEPNKTAAAIETILFAMGDSVEVSTLALAPEISQDEVREAAERPDDQLV